MAAKKTKKHRVKPPKRYAYMMLVTGASDKEVMIEAEKLRSLLEMKRVRFLGSRNSVGARGPVDRVARDFITYLRQIMGDEPAIQNICDVVERNLPR